MFKPSNDYLLLLLLLFFSSPAFADVYKWKDEKGRVHYGDVPHMAGTAVVKTDEQTEDQIANGERIRRESENSVREDAMEVAKEEAKEAARKSGKCKFNFFAYGDTKGKQLAEAARDECYNNDALISTGQGSKASSYAYNAWKEHHQMTNSRRSAALERSQNAEAQRQQQQQISENKYKGREIEMQNRYDLDLTKKYRGEIERDGTVRMKNLNGDTMRGTIDEDGYGRLRDKDGNTYRVRPR